MAKHEVEFSLPNRPLGRADVEFRVWRDEKMHGTLAVSNGSVVWFPSGTSYGYKLGWKRFAALMEDQATRFERR